MFLAQLVAMRSPLPIILLSVHYAATRECAPLPRPYLFAALLTASGAPLPHQTRHLSNLLAAAAPAGSAPAVRPPRACVAAGGNVLGGSSEVESKPSRGGRPIGSAASGGLFAAPRFASRVWQVHYLSGTGGERHADEQPVAAGGGGGGGGLVASADARPTAAPRLCAERRAAAACGRRQRGAGPRMRRQHALGPRAPRRPSSTRCGLTRIELGPWNSRAEAPPRLRLVC